MGKKLNTVLFILGATMANLGAMVVIFLVMLLPFARFIAPEMPSHLARAVLIGLFVLSIVLTYLLYYRVVRFLASRYDLDSHFESIFPKKK